MHTSMRSFFFFIVREELGKTCATKMVKAALEKSKELDVKMNIAVVDRGANLISFLR